MRNLQKKNFNLFWLRLIGSTEASAEMQVSAEVTGISVDTGTSADMYGISVDMYGIFTEVFLILFL